MEDALRRAKMSVQPLETSDTLACPGTPRCPPILKSSKPVRRCPLARSRRVLVRSAATVEARPTPSGKPRHSRSPDRLPVNFSSRFSWRNRSAAPTGDSMRTDRSSTSVHGYLSESHDDERLALRRIVGTTLAALAEMDRLLD